MINNCLVNEKLFDVAHQRRKERLSTPSMRRFHLLLCLFESRVHISLHGVVNIFIELPNHSQAHRARKWFDLL